jgi:hypothetical protein
MGVAEGEDIQAARQGSSAAALRAKFRAIPKEARDAHQPFSIRVWRGLSWLERGEQAADPETRFIFLWIAFNSIYGYMEDDGCDARDHGSWQAFLARMVERDSGGALDRLVRGRQADILRLIDNRFLFRPFWLGLADADEKLRRAVRRALKDYNDGNTLLGPFRTRRGKRRPLRSKCFTTAKAEPCLWYIWKKVPSVCWTCLSGSRITCP